MSQPVPDFPVDLDVQELLAVHSTLAAQQISGLLRQVAELAATNSALRRMLVQQAEQVGNATPHPKPRAVGGD